MIETPDHSRGPCDAGLRIRRATPDDATHIARIATAAWQAAYRGILPDAFLAGLRVDSRERAWRARLESETGGISPVWIAERAGEPIGFANSGPSRDEDGTPETLEVYAIYVHPAAWRSGAGRALLEAATADARARGARTLTLWVLEDNERGRAFYEAMGWRPDGGRQLFEFADVAAPEVRYRLELPASGV